MSDANEAFENQRDLCHVEDRPFATFMGIF